MSRPADNVGSPRGVNAEGNLCGRLLRSTDAARLERPALRRGDEECSYDELRGLVGAVARRLLREGILPGDRVALFFGNSPEYVVSFLAVVGVGAIAVPVDPNAGPGRIAFLLEDAAPKVCLAGPDKKSPEPVSVPAISVTADLGAKRVVLAPAGPVDAASEEWAVHGMENDPAVILFSSGTTGRPKGAVLSHGQLLHVARVLADIMGMEPGHRELSLSPMTHSGGWQRITATLLAGGCVVVPQGELSIQNILENVSRQDIRGFFAPPPLLRVLLKAPTAKVRAAAGGLRCVESASAPLSPEELRALMELLPRCGVFFQYGLTECSRAFILDARAHPRKLHTVGLPTPGIEARIVRESGEPAAAGETGEIWLRGPQRCAAYWRKPGLDHEHFREGWLMTGDFGSLDAEGFLSFQGRRDDKINCGGFSYFPAEAERALGRAEGVQEYLIAGVPDPQGVLGQVPWAFVVPAAEGWSSAAFIAAARRLLPPHMVPRKVVSVPSIPLTAAVKPDRRRTVRLYGPEAA